LDLDRPPSILDTYWNGITKRAKQVPMKVTSIPGSFPLRESLPRKFRDAKAIHSLHFYLKFHENNATFPEIEVAKNRLDEIYRLEFPIP